jgi:hypothetical protein
MRPPRSQILAVYRKSLHFAHALCHDPETTLNAQRRLRWCQYFAGTTYDGIVTAAPRALDKNWDNPFVTAGQPKNTSACNGDANFLHRSVFEDVQKLCMKQVYAESLSDYSSRM